MCPCTCMPALTTTRWVLASPAIALFGKCDVSFKNSKEFTMLKFWRSVVLVLGVCAVATSFAVAEDAPVSGTFKGNGKEAKLAFVTALKGEPYLDKPTIVLVMTEKDHSQEKKPEI